MIVGQSRTASGTAFGPQLSHTETIRRLTAFSTTCMSSQAMSSHEEDEWRGAMRSTSVPTLRHYPTSCKYCTPDAGQAPAMSPHEDDEWKGGAMRSTSVPTLRHYPTSCKYCAPDAGQAPAMSHHEGDEWKGGAMRSTSVPMLRHYPTLPPPDALSTRFA
jgi:hypothetical protein